jgi:hypothetical protein
MVATIPFNPFPQINGNAGLFNTHAVGFRQGTAMADPSTRFRLRAGILSQSETIPMWGGVGVYANVPGGDPPNTTQPIGPLGTIVGRATGLTGTFKLIGFSVFDEAYGMVTSPQSPVPLAASGMQVNYYPLGSLARVVVACDPSLASAASVIGSSVQTPVSWDFTNQLLVPYLGSLGISSGTYNSTTGLVTLTMSAPLTFGAGDSITVAGLSGTGAFASLAGTYTALSVSGSTVTYTAATGLGAATIGGGTVTVGGAATQNLDVEVLAVRTTNNETVTYTASTGFATWNYNGAAALIALNVTG